MAGSQTKSKFWKLLGYISLIIGIISGLVSLFYTFWGDDKSTYQTSGKNSPIISSDEGDVSIEYNVIQNKDSVKYPNQSK